MSFVLYILLALAVLSALPYVIFAVKRSHLAVQLKSICRKKGYTFTPLKAFWWLDTVKSGDCACKIETADTCYSLKIIGTVSRRHHLRFLSKTQFAVRSLRFETHMTSKASGYSYKPKEPYRFDEVVSEKPIHPVLLLCPTPTTISVKRTNGSGEQADTPSYVTPKVDAPRRDELLQNGDFTGEGYVYTAKAFLNKL
ncbi:MAG: hypothetical protein IJC52_01285 [Clostridia bacterium]|nr:hypothetical protein [Clostridia bacterium]